MSKVRGKQMQIGDKILLGYKEWVSLPDLGIPKINAKIDTGATFSTLHALDISLIKKNKKTFVKFIIQPFLQDRMIFRSCSLPIIDERTIISSNGERERRYIIQTALQLNDRIVDINVTLTNRSLMRFPMLLGRKALEKVAIIDPSKAYCLGKFTREEVKTYY